MDISSHSFATYFEYYINLVKDNSDVVDALERTHLLTNSLMNTIDEEQGNYAYAEGKWTVKELLVHVIDTERIFCERALRFARNDKTELPGFDHDNYVLNSSANERSLADIRNEFEAVRTATVALFNSFTPEMLNKEGVANKNHLTVLAIGYIIAGHEKHHVNVLKEKYRL